MKKTHIRFLKNKKGISPMIEQVFVILFGLFLLIMIILVFTNLRTKSFEYVATSQFASVASYVHNGIVIAQQDMRVSDSGRVYLDLPDKIGDKPYRILIQNRTINITDIDGVLNASITLFNINATVVGNVSSGSGGRIFLFYNRSANNITLKAEERVIST